MKYRLVKLSAPGWEKDFNTEDDLKKEFFDHICNGCRVGDTEYYIDPVTVNSTLSEMLNSPCGCEFFVEDIK